jgi:uncharacterized sulfatase
VNPHKLTRRDFLRFAAGSTAAALLPLGMQEFVWASQKDKPNIVLIVGDDMSWHDASCYSLFQNVKTPNMDRLAAEGIRFNHAYSTTAMCAPCRQELYTGLQPVRNGAYPNHSKVKPGIKSICHYLGDMGYHVAHRGKTHFGPKESFPFEKIPLETLLKNGKPFCYVFCSKEPHLPWDKGDPSRFASDKITLPPYMLDTPTTRTAMSQYLAEVEVLDKQVGNIVKTIDKSGKADNTIIIFFSEQGSTFPGCKWTCYDPGLRAAVVARWPKRVKPGSVTDAMIQYADVVPTLIEACGGKPPEDLDGRSFLEVLLGQKDSHRDYVFGQQTTKGISKGTPGGYAVRSVRSRTHKLILNLQSENTFRNGITNPDKNRKKKGPDYHA